MSIEINSDDVLKAKCTVVSSAFGINSLSEDDLLTELETLYWQGFKAGFEKLQEVDQRRLSGVEANDY